MMINPDTQKPYTAEEIIASHKLDGIELDHDEIYSVFGKHKQPTGPILMSDFQPRPKKMPPRPFAHVCTVEQALKNAPQLKKKPIMK